MTKEFYNIWVVGPFSSGKSTFVSTLAGIEDYITNWKQFIPFERTYLETIYQRPVSDQKFKQATEEYISSVDLFAIEVDANKKLFFVAPPGTWLGHLRLFDNFSVNLLGVIFLLDSSKPETFKEFRSIVGTILSSFPPLAYVLAANRQDDPKALSIPEWQDLLFPEIQEELIPCIAHDKESVKNVVIELLKRVVPSD